MTGSEGFVLPAGSEDYVGAYGPVLFDSHCGEPVAWGWHILRQMPDNLWLQVRAHAECASYGSWVIVARQLTRKEAEESYGAITAEEFGPRGGWKSVTFGSKCFISKRLRGPF